MIEATISSDLCDVCAGRCLQQLTSNPLKTLDVQKSQRRASKKVLKMLLQRASWDVTQARDFIDLPRAARIAPKEVDGFLDIARQGLANHVGLSDG
jgi:hypothetical protein